MFKKQIIVLLTMAAIVLGAVFYTSYNDNSVELAPSTADSDTAGNASPASATGKIVVYITGAVNNPGVIELPAESRIIDAVNKCGGLSESADAENINLSAKITDGLQIKVPVKNADTSATAATAGNKGAADSKTGKININSADEAELDKLPGIGPAMAKRIVEYRQSEGRFGSIDDLKKVRGIGESKFNSLKDKVAI